MSSTYSFANNDMSPEPPNPEKYLCRSPGLFSPSPPYSSSIIRAAVLCALTRRRLIVCVCIIFYKTFAYRWCPCRFSTKWTLSSEHTFLNGVGCLVNPSVGAVNHTHTHRNSSLPSFLAYFNWDQRTSSSQQASSYTYTIISTVVTVGDSLDFPAELLMIMMMLSMMMGMGMRVVKGGKKSFQHFC